MQQLRKLMPCRCGEVVAEEVIDQSRGWQWCPLSKRIWFLQECDSTVEPKSKQEFEQLRRMNWELREVAKEDLFSKLASRLNTVQ